VIPLSDRKKDFFMTMIALLWAFALIACWAGAFIKNGQLVYYGFIAVSLIVVFFYLLGASTNGKISILVILFPVILNLAVWITAFSIVYMTKNQKLGFIIGMHPGMLGMIIVFWIGSIICTALSLNLWFERYYLPDERWNDFIKETARLKKESGL
jgi:hypothetical protein